MIAHCHAKQPLSFRGQSFVDRTPLARHLAPLTGRTVKACFQMLAKRDDDGERVVVHYQKLQKLAANAASGTWREMVEAANAQPASGMRNNRTRSGQ